MKFKWNWLDTVIVCVVVLLAVAAAVFFLWPHGEAPASNESYIFVTFDTDKARVGTYDDLKVGDKILLTANGKELGEIVSVDIQPFKNTVFNEATKEYEVFENENFPFCRFTVKASGYISDANEAFVSSKAVLFGEEWFLETTSIRVAAKVSGVEGAGTDE